VASVGILGYGRFGRAFGELLAEAQLTHRAFDPYATVPVERRADCPRTLVEGARFVVLAVPVARMPDVLGAIRPFLTPHHVVFDVGSVKVHPTEAMRDALGEAIPWAGSHPLFGPTSLALAERPLRVVLCPSPWHPEATKEIRTLYERIGCEVIEQTPEGHDRVMAHTHALTFFLAKGMIDAGVTTDVPFAPPSFQAFAHVLAMVRSDAGHLFAAIERENPYASEARTHLVETLLQVHRALEATRDTLAEDGGPDVTRFTIPDLGDRSPELRQAREHIDEVDRELVTLLARRAQLARRAAHAKNAIGHPVLDPVREAALLTARRKWALDEGLDPDTIEEVFRAVVRFSRSAQRKG
jgi:prephenate dehydrogenase